MTQSTRTTISEGAADLSREGVAEIALALRQLLADVFSLYKMLLELRDDNVQLTRFLRAAHELCGSFNDVATTSLIEVWIDRTERRTWFLGEVAGEV